MAPTLIRHHILESKSSERKALFQSFSFRKNLAGGNKRMALTKNQVRELKAQAQEIKAKILVGKNGVNEGTLQSIDEVLTADEIVKIKFLNSSIDVDQTLCEELAAQLDAEFVQKIGRVVVLYREKM